jgi:predicted nucleotidyltransferase
MLVLEAVVARRDEILEIAARHGATNVRVFGSVARGTAGPDSDLDLLIDVGAKTSSWFPGGLVTDLDDLLGCRADVVTESALYHAIRDCALAEARPL